MSLHLCRTAVDQGVALVLICSAGRWSSKHVWSCLSSTGIDLQSLNSYNIDDPEAS